MDPYDYRVLFETRHLELTADGFLLCDGFDEDVPESSQGGLVVRPDGQWLMERRYFGSSSLIKKSWWLDELHGLCIRARH